MITAEAIKSARQRVDKLINGVGKLQKSREVSLAFTNAQRCKSFLGLVLKDMEQPNPYPESMDKDSKKIEPQADKGEEYNFDATDHLGQIKELRNDFEKEISGLRSIYLSAAGTDIKPENQPFFPTHLITSILALEEAKMWLGWELDEIRKRNEQK